MHGCPTRGRLEHASDAHNRVDSSNVIDKPSLYLFIEQQKTVIVDYVVLFYDLKEKDVRL